MNIFELTITTLLKRDVHNLDSLQEIGRFINFSMEDDDELRKFHKETQYKHYVFQNFSPVENKSGGVYKEGKLYFFKIRTLNEDFANKMHSLLNRSNDLIQVIAVAKTTMRKGLITEIKTITPVISTISSSPWLPENGILTLQQRIQANLEKKYRHFNKIEERIPFEPAIKGIEVLSRCPVPLSYKGRKMLGFNVRLEFNEDEDSQKLARVALGAGLGEKNSSIGCGYGIPVFI